MLSSQSSMDLLYGFFNKMNREHAVIWCARLERLTWEAFKWDSALPGGYFGLHNCVHPSTILQPFSYHLQATHFDVDTTEYDDKMSFAMRFRPAPLDLLCQWVEKLIQSRNGNLCWIKFLYSNTDNIQGMTYHGHGLGVIRKHWQHRKYR